MDINNLTSFPTIATQNAANKTSHWLVRRPNLLQIITTLLRFTLSARKRVSHRFNILFKFALISDALGLNKFVPFLRQHLVVRHEGQFVRLDFATYHHLRQLVISQVHKYAAQMVKINLNKELIVPLLHDLSSRGLFESPIINTLFQIGGMGRIFL